jgi:hypothetical protein
MSNEFLKKTNSPQIASLVNFLKKYKNIIFIILMNNDNCNKRIILPAYLHSLPKLAILNIRANNLF